MFSNMFHIHKSFHKKNYKPIKIAWVLRGYSKQQIDSTSFIHRLQRIFYNSLSHSSIYMGIIMPPGIICFKYCFIDYIFRFTNKSIQTKDFMVISTDSFSNSVQILKASTPTQKYDATARVVWGTIFRTVWESLTRGARI